VSFIRCTGINALVSNNSSGDTLFEDLHLTIRANSQHQTLAQSQLVAVITAQPIVNINPNLGSGSHSVRIINPYIKTEGYINASSECLRAISINGDDVLVQGEYPDCAAGNDGYIESPDFNPGVAGTGITASGDNILVDGIRIVGDHTISILQGNIRFFTGTGNIIRNCVVDAISPLELGDRIHEDNLTNEEWLSGCFIEAQENLENTVPPVVSGTLTRGSILSCTTGTWSNELNTYSYQWRRNGENILDAKSPSYLITQSDTGQQLSCIVTAIGIQRSVSQISNSVTIQDYRTSTYVKRKGIRKGFYN
jgi:hypothetical protein